MRSTSAMRTALAVLVILLLAPFGGVATASPGQPVDLGIEGDEILPVSYTHLTLPTNREV